MPNPTGSASAVAQITPRRKPQARQTADSSILTAQYADGSGMLAARSYPVEVTADLSVGTGERLALISSQLLHGLPQASRVVGS